MSFRVINIETQSATNRSLYDLIITAESAQLKSVSSVNDEAPLILNGGGTIPNFVSKVVHNNNFVTYINGDTNGVIGFASLISGTFAVALTCSLSITDLGDPTTLTFRIYSQNSSPNVIEQTLTFTENESTTLRMNGTIANDGLSAADYINLLIEFQGVATLTITDAFLEFRSISG